MIFSLQIIFKQISPLGKGRVWRFQSLLTVANTLYIDKGKTVTTLVCGMQLLLTFRCTILHRGKNTQLLIGL
jgi:hypothetical protein